MITATMAKDKIIIEGHAQTRVCAAVSVLVQSTFNAFIALTNDSAHIISRIGYHELDHGVYEHLTTKGRMLIDSLTLAFKEMAKDYPGDFTLKGIDAKDRLNR